MRIAFIVVSIVVFLLFVGVSVYRMFYPGPWSIECNRRDSSGAIISTVRARATNRGALDRFLAAAHQSGESCVKSPNYP
jgi:hypothetical protein